MSTNADTHKMAAFHADMLKKLKDQFIGISVYAVLGQFYGQSHSR